MIAMKKATMIAALITLSMLLLTGCDAQHHLQDGGSHPAYETPPYAPDPAEPEPPTYEPAPTSPEVPPYEPYEPYEPNDNIHDWPDYHDMYSEPYMGIFRPSFRSLPAHIIDLADIDNAAYIAWVQARSPQERANEHIAVSFIRDFNISQEDFERANEALRRDIERFEPLEYQLQGSSFGELFPVDLIFSFDNERINEYFLWRNSPSIAEFGIDMYDDDMTHRLLFYHMPAPFAALVGRENFIHWRNARSEEERRNESIAVSFIRYFNVSQEDFAEANEQVRQFWQRQFLRPEAHSLYEVYPVALIFSFDNDAISAYFQWCNSPAVHERPSAY